MAYSNFTLESVRTAFQLETVESIDLFSEIEPIREARVGPMRCRDDRCATL